jgi:hypothetical protein
MEGSGDVEGEAGVPETSGERGEVNADRIEHADPVEPGRPSAENTAFVLLGVLGALYVIARIAGLV